MNYITATSNGGRRRTTTASRVLFIPFIQPSHRINTIGVRTQNSDACWSIRPPIIPHINPPLPVHKTHGGGAAADPNLCLLESEAAPISRPPPANLGQDPCHQGHIPARPSPAWPGRTHMGRVGRAGRHSGEHTGWRGGGRGSREGHGPRLGREAARSRLVKSAPAGRARISEARGDGISRAGRARIASESG
jgi:hypothetical protein